jgi:flagellar protein FliS
MMYNANPYNLYKNSDIDTSSNYELVSKLFGKAALNLKMAMMHIDQRRLDKACTQIVNSQIIITTLNESLDMKYNIANQFRMLYLYMLKRLREANIKKDKQILLEISDILLGLRDTWNEAIKNFKMTGTQ